MTNVLEKEGGVLQKGIVGRVAKQRNGRFISGDGLRCVHRKSHLLMKVDSQIVSSRWKGKSDEEEKKK